MVIRVVVYQAGQVLVALAYLVGQGLVDFQA